MPVTWPKKRGLPETIKRRAALREIAQAEARSKPTAALVLGGGGLSRKQADARAKELAKEPMPHTRAFWDREIAPDYE